MKNMFHFVQKNEFFIFKAKYFAFTEDFWNEGNETDEPDKTVWFTFDVDTLKPLIYEAKGDFPEEVLNGEFLHEVFGEEGVQITKDFCNKYLSDFERRIFEGTARNMARRTVEEITTMYNKFKVINAKKIQYWHLFFYMLYLKYRFYEIERGKIWQSLFIDYMIHIMTN